MGAKLAVVIAPNAYRQCLAARQAAGAMAEGLRRGYDEGGGEQRADLALALLPMADGGDGTMAVLAGCLDHERRRCRVRGPLGHWIEADYLWFPGDHSVLIEMSETSGMRRLDGPNAPWRAASWGLGDCIRAALDDGAQRITVGIGGSATVDGGAGALKALGAAPQGVSGDAIAPCPAAMERMAGLDLNGLDPRLFHTELVFWADVATPPAGAARLYGPQKGFRGRELAALERALAKWIGLLPADPGAPLMSMPFLGAGGAVAAAFAFLPRFTILPGARAVAAALGLEGAIAAADLVLTGEGRLDPTTLAGKAPGVVAELAAEHDVPLVFLAGSGDENVRLPGQARTVIMDRGGRAPDATRALDRIAAACRDLGLELATRR